MASELMLIKNVKLRLRAVKGKNYIISRSMEVTQKAKSISRYVYSFQVEVTYI